MGLHAVDLGLVVEPPVAVDPQRQALTVRLRARTAYSSAARRGPGSPAPCRRAAWSARAAVAASSPTTEPSASPHVDQFTHVRGVLGVDAQRTRVELARRRRFDQRLACRLVVPGALDGLLASASTVRSDGGDIEHARGAGRRVTVALHVSPFRKEFPLHIDVGHGMTSGTVRRTVQVARPSEVHRTVRSRAAAPVPRQTDRQCAEQARRYARRELRCAASGRPGDILVTGSSPGARSSACPPRRDAMPVHVAPFPTPPEPTIDSATRQPEERRRALRGSARTARRRRPETAAWPAAEALSLWVHALITTHPSPTGRLATMVGRCEPAGAATSRELDATCQGRVRAEACAACLLRLAEQTARARMRSRRRNGSCGLDTGADARGDGTGRFARCEYPLARCADRTQTCPISGIIDPAA